MANILPLLTVEEVAEIFQVSPRTVWRWVHAGKLPEIRTPGGTIRFHRDDIAALVEAGR